MSEAKRHPKRNSFDRRLALLPALLILFGGLEAILYATLRPFQFNFHAISAQNYIAGFVVPPDSALDFPLNVILFMPLGFGLAALLRYLKVPYKTNFVIVVGFGFFVTLLVESLQIFLVGRTSSVSDLIANTLGAATGFFCFRLWRRRNMIVYKLATILNISPPTMVALAIFLLLIMVATFLFASR